MERWGTRTTYQIVVSDSDKDDYKLYRSRNVFVCLENIVDSNRMADIGFYIIIVRNFILQF